MNSAAFHAYLDALSRSVFYAEEGDDVNAEAMRLEAAAAAAEAFDPGSERSRACGVLLDAACPVKEAAS